MKVVIDTNILLVSIPSRSKYHPIFQAYLTNKIILVITTDILFEYREILDTYSKSGAGKYIHESFLAASNIIVPNIYYRWELISSDVDDNKFTDAYVAAGADYLVTNDRHFNEAGRNKFPSIKIVTADEFLSILETEINSGS